MAGYVLPARRSQDWSLRARLGGVRALGAPVRLATGFVSTPRVAVGADGTAVAAWIANSELRVAVARPGHNFARAQTLGRVRALGGVAVTSSGRAVVAWRLGTAAQVAVAAPGRPFGAPRTLGTTRLSAPAVTAAPSGTIVVAWLQTASAPKPPPAPQGPAAAPRIFAAPLPAGAASFSSNTELGRPTYGASGAGASSGPGGAAVTWRQSPAEQRIAPLGPGNAFQAFVPLASTGPPGNEDATFGERLSLAIPAGGTYVALWLQTPVGGAAVVKAATRPAGGPFSTTRTLSASGWTPWPPAATALSDRSLAAWTETRGQQSRVRLAVHPVGGGWTALGSPRTPSLDALTLGVAASSRYAVVTWIQDKPTSSTSLGGGRVYLTTYRPQA